MDYGLTCSFFCLIATTALVLDTCLSYLFFLFPPCLYEAFGIFGLFSFLPSSSYPLENIIYVGISFGLAFLAYLFAAVFLFPSFSLRILIHCFLPLLSFYL